MQRTFNVHNRCEQHHSSSGYDGDWCEIQPQVVTGDALKMSGENSCVFRQMLIQGP